MRARIQQLILLFLCLSGLCSISFSTYAEKNIPFKHIVILGDSLSDNGNLYRGNVEWWVPIPAYFIPSQPYFEGRFSDGPVWADKLASRMDAQNIQTTNYAAGGALVDWHVGLYLPYTLKHMMDRFFNKEAWADRLDDTLFIIWIGGNDYLHGIQYFSDVEKDSDSTIRTLGNNINELISKGANNFLLINLPDISIVPYVTTDKKMNLKLLVNAHNKKLAKLGQTFTNIYRSRGLKIQILDAYALINDVIYDPVEFNKKHGTHLNIQYTTIPCWKGGYRLRNSADKDTATIYNRLDNISLNTSRDNQLMAETIIASPDLYEAWSAHRQFILRKGMQCDNPENYMFWDKLHPTTAMHTAIDQLVLEHLAANW